jgi:hypothetical protein
MADTSSTPKPPAADQDSPGTFGEEPGVSTPTSIGHGRLSVEENVPGTPAPEGQPPKDTDAAGVTP